MEGGGEIEALGAAFNEMQGALAARTSSLKQAVVDLCGANASLLQAPGEGTGLGLANARYLAQEMGGDVTLQNGPSPLGGASFVFRLPRASKDLQTDSDVSRSFVRGTDA